VALDFQQTDSNATCTASDAYCSGLSVYNTANRQASDGGTAGSTPVSISIGSSSTGVAYRVGCVVAATVSWDAGTWTVRFNVSTANMNITWDAVYLCRVNSACANQESLGSATGLGISCGTTGVKSTTVSGSGTTPGAGDEVYVVCSFANGAMSLQSFSVTPDQLISSPFSVAATPASLVFDPFRHLHYLVR
jgi:hypothetical protein